MSQKEALTFLEKIEKDPQFKSELAKLKNEADFKKLKDKYHLHFTKEEFQQVYKSKYHKQLTPHDLAKIAAAGGEPIKESAPMPFFFS